MKRIKLEVYRLDSRWVCRAPEFGAFSVGGNATEAVGKVMENLEHSLDGLKNEPDSLLTQDARELRDKLRECLGAGA